MKSRTGIRATRHSSPSRCSHIFSTTPHPLPTGRALNAGLDREPPRGSGLCRLGVIPLSSSRDKGHGHPHIWPGEVASLRLEGALVYDGTPRRNQFELTLRRGTGSLGLSVSLTWEKGL